MDKRIEYAMNTLINTEIWSTNLYLSLQVYFEGQQLPILASWLSAQAQDNMGKVYQMMNRIYHEGAVHKTDICKYGVYGIVAYPGHGI